MSGGPVIVHIGVPKSGTTAIQSALEANRDRLADLGVVYPGSGLHHVPHLRAPLDWPADAATAAQDAQKWERLRRRTRRSERVVISAESIAAASQAQAATIVEGLGGDRVQIVLTVRSLASLVPAAYQEEVKAGVTTDYPTWLADVCAGDGARPGSDARFWGVQDHTTLVDRWVEVVGAERLTVVVIDSARPNGVFEAFDEIIGLPAGTLDPATAAHANRSMTAAECELVRRLNTLVGTGELIDIRHRPVPARAVWAMLDERRPLESEERLTLPAWARHRLAPIARHAIDTITASGCRVIGDLDRLAIDVATTPGEVRPESVPAEQGAPESVPIDAAAVLVAWLLRNGVERRRSGPQA